MKLALQVKLLPTPEQESALVATLLACNTAAGEVSRVAFERDVKTRNDLQKITYADLKLAGLGAQCAVRTIKKVVDAYATLRSNIKSGLLGPEGAKRRVRAESKPIEFRAEAGQPFDDRMLSWQHDAQTVSIWTVHGRMKNVSYAGHPDHLKSLRQYRQGESDLVRRDGKWYLIATCEVTEEPLNTVPCDWVGVDRGIVNLATTSDADNYSGRRLRRYRRRQAKERAELQAKRTRSATRRAKKRARKERRHAAQVNHIVSKDIVAVAKRTDRGIALEELRSIRERVRRATRSRTQQVSIHGRKVMLRASVRARPHTHMRHWQRWGVKLSGQAQG